MELYCHFQLIHVFLSKNLLWQLAQYFFDWQSSFPFSVPVKIISISSFLFSGLWFSWLSIFCQQVKCCSVDLLVLPVFLKPLPFLGPTAGSQNQPLGHGTSSYLQTPSLVQIGTSPVLTFCLFVSSMQEYSLWCVPIFSS